MKARLRKLASDLGETFWLLPAAMVAGGVVLALFLLAIDRSGAVPAWAIKGPFLYDGGGSGARALLGAIASSTIGVAGTVFSITIAALSLAAGQMGPRLLRNFVRDRGVQMTLGTFLGTFSYALMVLRSIRTEDEGAFIPHLALSTGIALAFVCVATLVFFVAHMAGRINVDTVISLVGRELSQAIARLTVKEAEPSRPDDHLWENAHTVTDRRRGYLQQLDTDGLAGWAARHDTRLRLLVRPGDHIFPGSPVALTSRAVDGIDEAIVSATALGDQRVSTTDLEFAVRQLVEVAVRALSPGINDPNTAISVLDRLGASLCDVSKVHLPTGVHERDGQAVLVTPAIDYAGLTDAMFHMIRQNATSSPAVLIRMMDVLTAVMLCEHDPGRRAELQRHADLVLSDAEREIANPSDLADLSQRHARLAAARDKGACALLSQ